MKTHQYILTGILLILVGMAIGVLLMIVRTADAPFSPTEVKVTEVKRSTTAPESDMNPIMESGTTIRDVARAVVPTVVYIETSVSARRAVPEDGNHDFEEDLWERFFPRGRSSSVGSGVIFSEDGFILTNNHVVAGGRNVRVTLHDKREFEAEVVGRDPSTDLAVLRIQGENLPSITLGDSDHVQVGDWVMAIGNPLRLRSTITAGIVSALGRDVQIINDQMRIESFIQTDAAINKGNSGGALVNASGELVGINTAIATESGMNQGYGFAIPINMAFKIGRDLMEFGSVQRGFLGVQIASIDQSRARQLGMDRITGVEVAGIVEGQAAGQAGIRSGDVFLKVNEREVSEPNQLQAEIAMFRPGDTVGVVIWRNGEEISKQIELAPLANQDLDEWPEPDTDYFEMPLDPDPESEPEESEEEESGEPEASEPSSIRFDKGFTVEELDIEEHQELGIQMHVTQVRRFSSARRAGLRANDIIITVNGHRPQSLLHLEELINEAAETDSISLMVMRGNSFEEIEF